MVVRVPLPPRWRVVGKRVTEGACVGCWRCPTPQYANLLTDTFITNPNASMTVSALEPP